MSTLETLLFRPPPAQPRWIEPEPLPQDSPRVHELWILNDLLLRRGITTTSEASEFIDGRARQAPDPFALPGMDLAAQRIKSAVESGERIAIFGDYDVDGITSTAIMLLALRQAQQSRNRVLARLPHRREGYGLSRVAIDELVAYGATLLIAVDCASSDHLQVAYARQKGLDVVIVDHHHMQDEGPAGAIVVSAYRMPGLPYREFSASGLAWLLVIAMNHVGLDTGDPIALQDLATLGALADMSVVTGVHRPILRDGIAALRNQPRPGLTALARRANLDLKTLDSESAVFKLTPRLNAAGRLGDPQIALDLILASDPVTAAGLAEEVERLNTQRRAISDAIANEAAMIFASRPDWQDQAVILVSRPGWAQGVLGIAAAQLTQRFGRPAVLLGEEGVFARGSARSVPGVSIIAALHACNSLVERSGGHNQAAGLTVQTDKIDALRDALNVAIASQGVTLPVEATLQFDTALTAEHVSIRSALAIEQLQPHGNGNERPLLLVRGLKLQEADVVGQDRRHLRMSFSAPSGWAKGIFFGAASRLPELNGGSTLELAAQLGVDRWNGQERVNFDIKDFRVF